MDIRYMPVLQKMVNISRIKATKGTGMTEEKLATGKTRYYKVRAYRKVNGKAVYGSFSKVKKVVIK